MDVGKTQAKISLWSANGRMLDRRTRPNGAGKSGALALLDTAATAEWLIETLTAYCPHPIAYIVPVAHGAAMAAVGNGVLAFPSPDYEGDLAPQLLAEYRTQRDPFSATGSPALPGGLNLGAQLHCLEAQHEGLFSDTELMPYAQYWAWLLTGNAVSEVTSLGCHSDLWNPAQGDFSDLAKRRGWAGQFAPLVKADEIVGTLKPELAAATGLSPQVKVLAGLHDSNAALLAARGFAEIADHEATVLSTGTWFIAMRLTKQPIDVAALPEERDCLVNVDADGDPVPSARFMGGREIERLIELDTRQVDIKPDQPQLLAAVPRVLTSGAMVLPTLAPGNGPFPDGTGEWVNRPDDWIERRAAACLYAALLADTSLGLIGSRKTLLVEGRFAEAEVFVRALASLRPDTQVLVGNAHNDVSFGALRLVDPSLEPEGDLRPIAPLEQDITDYADSWRAAAKDRQETDKGIKA